METYLHKTMRDGVWETNSSSTHSISISPAVAGELLDTIVPDRDGRIVLRGGQFGWEMEKFTDALTKANYLAVSCGYMQPSRQAKIENVLEGTSLLTMLFNVIKEQTGATEVVYTGSDDYDAPDSNWSYIDHESVYTAKEAMVSAEAMHNFIFNKRCVLYIANDNDDRHWDHATGKLVTTEY